MSSPTKPTATIDDLPPEMICELFEYLPLRDLVVCSMVNKRWHSIYAAFKKHKLVIMQSRMNFINAISCHRSNRPIAEADRCRPWMFSRLAEKPLLSKLNHLTLSDFREFEFDLNKLNRFQQLVHLEIHRISSDQREMHLNLPRLKVLVINEYNGYHELSIDCPLLSTLAYFNEDEGRNLLKVKQPETIRKLETIMFGPKLDPFKGVECLVTRRFELISKATLLTLPRLREFQHVKSIEALISFYNGAGTLDMVKRTLSEFVDEAKKLRGNDFRFSSVGFQLTNVNVDQIDFGVQVDERSGEERVFNEYVYLKNYHLIEPGALHFVDRINYIRLLSNVAGEIPHCFSQKFTGINKVHATAKVRDTNHLLQFLKSLRFLRKLELENTQLSQKFYDQLPASAHLLVSLHLGTGYCEDELQLNFDFIDKLSGLSELEITQTLSLESFPSLVRSLDKSELERVDFDVRSGEERFWIAKYRYSTRWNVYGDVDLLFKTESPGEIVNFVQERSPESLDSD